MWMLRWGVCASPVFAVSWGAPRALQTLDDAVEQTELDLDLGSLVQEDLAGA